MERSEGRRRCRASERCVRFVRLYDGLQLYDPFASVLSRKEFSLILNNLSEPLIQGSRVRIGERGTATSAFEYAMDLGALLKRVEGVANGKRSTRYTEMERSKDRREWRAYLKCACFAHFYEELQL